ncbi:MAG: respiratory nitrate reductase subunit gamma [Candidatus Odinarchaeota archaeon]
MSLVLLETAIDTVFFMVLPYLAVLIFFAGLAYRVLKWQRIPAPNVPLAFYPPPKSTAVSLALDETVFPRLMKNKILWLFGFLLHLVLVLLIIGHARLFYEYLDLLGLDAETAATFALLSGGTSGVLFLIAVLGLLLRRMSIMLRKISVPEDFFLLLLLLAIGITGDYMRFATHLDVTELQSYFVSLVFLNPTLPSAVYEPGFILHYALAMLLLIYFPFSKLVHLIGSVFTNILVKIPPVKESRTTGGK